MRRKTTVWTFQETNKQNLYWETFDIVRKKHFKKKTESLLIAAQNNITRTNYVKARIDKVQQNSGWRLYGDRDETINHIISESSKLAQKEYD